MKILIDDCMRIALGTGIGLYSKYLAQSLDGIVDVELVDFKSPIRNRIISRFLYLLYINSPWFIHRCSKYDCVHFTGQFLPFFKAKTTKFIVTIHDVVAFKHPETMSALASAISRMKIKMMMKKADTVLTVSHYVKEEMAELFPQYEYKVNVIYPGHYSQIGRIDGDILFEDRLTCLNNHPFFLFVGTIEKRKNVGIIIEAFIKFKRKYPSLCDFKLILAGRDGFGFESLHKLAIDSPYYEDIIFTGYVSNETVNKLYNKSCAYIFPSVYEGFGSTQLECMACKTPIILSDIPTNREISGKYGLFFSLNDIDSLVTQMHKVAIGEYNHEDHSILAEKYMKNFDWKTLVFKYIEVYKSTIESLK